MNPPEAPVFTVVQVAEETETSPPQIVGGRSTKPGLQDPLISHMVAFPGEGFCVAAPHRRASSQSCILVLAICEIPIHPHGRADGLDEFVSPHREPIVMAHPNAGAAVKLVVNKRAAG